MKKRGVNRRTLLRSSVLGMLLGPAGKAHVLSGAQLPSAGSADDPGSYAHPDGLRTAPLERVRIGFVGVGGQGGSHVRNFLGIEGVDVVAICDIDAERASEVSTWVTDKGRPEPKLYTKTSESWRQMIEDGGIDLVFNSTPWLLHVPISIETMEAGIHTAVEVPAAITLDGCWQLVETAERTRRHCVMMENCNYGRREMMILNMVRQGVLGELLHAEGAYIHDLRHIKWSDHGEGLWRWKHSIDRDANLYPTHGLGPVAQCLNINRGDRFDYLVSMSSPQRGISLHMKTLDEEDPRRNHHYQLGDMNSSLIKTRLGRTILLQHDTTTPRPYSRLSLVQGTKGTVAGYPDRVFLDERSDSHTWQAIDDFWEEFDHPLWKKLEAMAEGAGHGGMDFLEDWRLIESLRTGTPMDMDVYDAAALSAPVELTERSNARRSEAVDFPDFTRGRWRDRTPVGIVS